MQKRKLILFIHGLGGSDETWGKFPEFTKEDVRSKEFDVKLFSYKTSLLRMRSVASISSKILSALLPQSLASKIASLLSFTLPQSRLPKIQHIAKQLESTIIDYYKNYDEIYLITHSMGGLVARKYLYNMIKEKKHLQVKKLMLYAVPNNGSHWAKFAVVYPHEQIDQLDEMNDFLELLNEEIDSIKLEDYLDGILYVVGYEDEVVPINSAKSYPGNPNVSYMQKGHINIVKPENSEDHPYKTFGNFILGDEAEYAEQKVQSLVLNEEAKNSPFVKEVFESLLTQKPLMVLYHQEFTTIVKEKRYLKEQAYHTFNKNVFELEIPTYQDEKSYFKYLAKACNLSSSIDSSVLWKDALKQKLENGERLLLLISEIDNGNRELNTLLANGIRALQTNYENLFVLFIGRKKLAYLVHGENELSPLNGATELFFPLQNLLLEEALVVQILEKVKEDCDLLCDNIGMEWVAYSTTKVIRTLFWKNLLKNQEGHFAWQNDEVERVVKRYCGCE